MGQLNIPGSSLIYLDTVTIIYSIERFPDYIALLDPMWRQLRSGNFQVMTSELSLLETLVMPIRQANTTLIHRYETLLTASEVNLIPITRSILKMPPVFVPLQILKRPTQFMQQRRSKLDVQSF